MRLTRFTIIAGALISLTAGFGAVYAQLGNAAADSASSALVKDVTTQLLQSQDLSVAALAVKLDVVQVQQFLTDISATRGLDGLDDGTQKAAEFAKQLDTDIATAETLAASAGLTDVRTALGDIKTAFGPYYSTGQQMAAAYVASGPEGGNKLMGSFDATAETLGTNVDKLLAGVQAYSDSVRSTAATEEGQIADQQAFQSTVQLVTYIVLISAIAVMVGFMAGYALRRIRAMSATMVKIAKGDFTQSVYGSSVWEELKDIATAADTFRENGMRLQALAESEAEQRARATAERTAMMAQLREAFGTVVAAASAGNFEQRVAATFADPELNDLAQSVNTLVATVEGGLGETGRVLSALSQTDLTLRVTRHYEGAFAALKTDTNAVADKFTQMVQELRAPSQSLKTATSEMLAGVNDLADRTTRQAATVEETSAAIEQLAGTVRDNAEKAESAAERVRQASDAAQAGGQAIREANQAMDGIKASSQKISNIIGIIDDIAFQTNLLALNASVEAARAGEAGKGFAVVAVEVRRLAQSAATASNEVKQLIDLSRVEVDGGTKLVSRAAERLETMIGHVEESTSYMADIARASREQAGAISEISTAVSEMDQMTQHNSALVQQTNAAIEQTEQQASDLDRLVSVFRLADSPRTARPQPARRTARTEGNAALKDWSEF